MQQRVLQPPFAEDNDSRLNLVGHQTRLKDLINIGGSKSQEDSRIRLTEAPIHQLDSEQVESSGIHFDPLGLQVCTHTSNGTHWWSSLKF